MVIKLPGALLLLVFRNALCFHFDYLYIGVRNSHCLGQLELEFGKYFFNVLFPMFTSHFCYLF